MGISRCKLWININQKTENKKTCSNRRKSVVQQWRVPFRVRFLEASSIWNHSHSRTVATWLQISQPKICQWFNYVRCFWALDELDQTCHHSKSKTTSTTRLVLWDVTWVQRLWCIFELAAFLKSRGPMAKDTPVIRPILFGPCALTIFGFTCVVTWPSTRVSQGLIYWGTSGC